MEGMELSGAREEGMELRFSDCGFGECREKS